MEHAGEFRRCLIEADVAGIMKVWAHTAPHLVNLGPADAFVALHMARVEAKSIPRKLKQYSITLLAECGFEKIAGVWTRGQPQPSVAVETVAIASKSSDPAYSRQIVSVMQDALLNAQAKGIIVPREQQERMLKARRRFKFRNN
jgi:hypothetical protein